MSALAECLEVPEQHVQVSIISRIAAVGFCSYLTCDILAQVLADTVAAVSEVQICTDDQTAG